MTADSLDEASSGDVHSSDGSVLSLGANARSSDADVRPFAVNSPNLDVRFSGGDVRPSGGDVRPSGGDARPSGGDIRPSDNNVRFSDNNAHPSDNNAHPSDNNARSSNAKINFSSPLSSLTIPLFPNSPPFSLSPLSSPVLSLPVVQFTSLIRPSHSLELDIEPHPSSPKEVQIAKATPPEERVVSDRNIKERAEGRTRRERKRDLDDDETEFEIIEDEMEDMSDLVFDDETAILDSDLQDLFDVNSFQESTSQEDEPRRKQSVKQTRGKLARKTGVKSRKEGRRSASSRSKQHLTRSRTREKRKERSSRKQETDWDTFIESSFSLSDVETSMSENETTDLSSEQTEELPKRGRKRVTAEKSDGSKEGRKKKQLQDRGKGRKMSGFKS